MNKGDKEGAKKGEEGSEGRRNSDWRAYDDSIGSIKQPIRRRRRTPVAPIWIRRSRQARAKGKQAKKVEKRDEITRFAAAFQTQTQTGFFSRSRISPISVAQVVVPRG